MADRQVVAFHEVVGQHFPVGLPVEFLEECLLVAGHVKITDHFLDVCKGFTRWRCIFIECDQNPAQPLLDSHRLQAIRFTIESGVASHCRSTTQSAVQIVCPAMVWTDDGPRVAAPFKQCRHTVAADIRMGTKDTFTISHDHDRLTGEIKGKIVTGLTKPVRTTGTEPVHCEDLVQFLLHEFFRRVDAAWHRPCRLKWTRHVFQQLGSRINLRAQCIHVHLPCLMVTNQGHPDSGNGNNSADVIISFHGMLFKREFLTEREPKSGVQCSVTIPPHIQTI